jgi:hypothetical protein
MKFFIALVLLVGVSSSAFANFKDAIVNHSTVKAVYTLLNAANSQSCVAPTTKDVQSYCYGALPAVKQPTIIHTGCGFSLTVKCATGASATFSGNTGGYEIIDQYRHVSSYTDSGVVIENVVLH